MSGGRVQAIANCMDRPRLHERHLVPVMTLARTGLFFEGFCGSAMRFCITSRQRGSAVPARITTHPEVVRVVGHSVAVKRGFWKNASRSAGKAQTADVAGEQSEKAASFVLRVPLLIRVASTLA